MEFAKPLRVITYDGGNPNGHMTIGVNPSTFVDATPMRFVSAKKEANRPFVSMTFRRRDDKISTYDAEPEDAKAFLGFEVKAEERN